MYTNLTFWKKKSKILYAGFFLLLYTLFNINANKTVVALMILLA